MKTFFLTLSGRKQNCKNFFCVKAVGVNVKRKAITRLFLSWRKGNLIVKNIFICICIIYYRHFIGIYKIIFLILKNFFISTYSIFLFFFLQKVSIKNTNDLYGKSVKLNDAWIDRKKTQSSLHKCINLHKQRTVVAFRSFRLKKLCSKPHELDFIFLVFWFRHSIWFWENSILEDTFDYNHSSRNDKFWSF